RPAPPPARTLGRSSETRPSRRRPHPAGVAAEMAGSLPVPPEHAVPPRAAVKLTTSSPDRGKPAPRIPRSGRVAPPRPGEDRAMKWGAKAMVAMVLAAAVVTIVAGPANGGREAGR